ncbi:putative bifunctional diguanylate cyclase/phosphodiesterase [Pseudomonas luteola]
MFVDFLSNAALLLALCWLRDYLWRTWPHKVLSSELIVGCATGLICIAVMIHPVPIGLGIFVDARLAILSVTALMAGPLVASIAAAMTALYRFWLGGVGAYPGVLNAFMAVALGLAYRMAYHRGWIRQGPLQVLLLGGAVHALALLTLTLVYGPFGQAAQRTMLAMMLTMPPTGLLVWLLFRDQEKRNQAEQALARSEARLSAITQAIPDILLVIDQDGRFQEVVSSSHDAKKINEHLAKVGQRLQDVLPYTQANYLTTWVRKVLKSPTPLTVEYQLSSPAGERYFEGKAQAIASDAEHKQAIVMVTRDVTARHEYEEQIRRLAFYDTLTELPNRRFFLERLKTAQLACQRHGHSGALLFIDLDNFKNINDLYGHDAGDTVLKEAAHRLKQIVRATDTVARLGGDEFVILLEGLSEDEQAAAHQASHIGQQVLAALERPFEFEQGNQTISGSVGIVLFDSRSASHDLLQQADISMYSAKSHGKNAIRFYDPSMQSSIAARLQLEQQIRQGLLDNEFRVYYQLQWSDQKGLIGLEALLRWQHPDWGLVGPAAFLEVASNTGLLTELDRWLLDEVCSQLLAWSKEPSLAHLPVSVNVCASHLRQSSFATEVMDVLKHKHIDPALIKIELTEATLILDLDQACSHIETLRGQGVRFALDDFGTGYSSLNYLQKLPIDQVKIDQSFVQRLPGSESVAIIQAISGLATTFGLDIVAEGVESEAQRQLLAENGCTTYQGYLFAKPLPARDVVRAAELASN